MKVSVNQIFTELLDASPPLRLTTQQPPSVDFGEGSMRREGNTGGVNVEALSEFLDSEARQDLK